MELLGNRRPKNVTEYFTWLYCKKKNLPWKLTIHTKAMKTWKTLTPAEQDVFIDKYNKWRADNDKIVANILQHAEPFVKKKHTRENLNVDTLIDPDDDKQNESMDSAHRAASIEDNISNTFSEGTEQEDLNESYTAETRTVDDDDNQLRHHVPKMTPTNDDNVSIVTSDSTNRVYAASVIDTDIDENPVQQDVNEIAQCEILREPIRPAVKNARELFEILKSSGTQPELATMQWKDMTRRDRDRYFYALYKMKKEYLTQYEQYLESLPNPELFKHYIKTLNRYFFCFN